MRGYSTETVFSEDDLVVYYFAQEIVEAIADPGSTQIERAARAIRMVLVSEYGEDRGNALADKRYARLRCHELTRIVGHFIACTLPKFIHPSMNIVDGWYAGVDHSWIELRPGKILDVYAVARVPMVQLVDIGTPTLQTQMYEREAMRTDIRDDLVHSVICSFED